MEVLSPYIVVLLVTLHRVVVMYGVPEVDSLVRGK